MARREEGVTERLIESARVEFLEKGYDGASLRSIADRAGSSKGAIYIRYADKADLYADVYKRQGFSVRDVACAFFVVATSAAVYALGAAL